MNRAVGIMGAMIGGWVGWWLGRNIGLMTGFLLGVFGSGVGYYMLRRLPRDYME